MDMKRDYYEDLQLLNSNTKMVWYALLLVALVAIPFIVPSHYLNSINYITINIIVAIGLNILVGYTGQVSLGHAGFFAIGAYSTVLLLNSSEYMFFIFAVIIAGFIAALFGFILGLPSLRLEGPYLSIATLGFGMAITQILGRFSVFGGRNGLIVPKVSCIEGILVNSGYFTNSEAASVDLYVIIMAVTVLMALGARNITRTKVGRAFMAIRDDDIAAQAMGVNLTYYKTLSFAVSAFYTGIAGGLYAFRLGYINPESFDFILSALFLSMVVVGGVGSITGSILGAIIISYIDLNVTKDSIAWIPLLGDGLTYITKEWMNENGLASVRFIIYGLILVIVVVFEPLGLFGFWIRLKKYWKTWPF